MVRSSYREHSYSRAVVAAVDAIREAGPVGDQGGTARAVDASCRPYGRIAR
jgi:hypothetical protein